MKPCSILLCLLALVLAQVPWAPCHCGDGCGLRPVFATQTTGCADPDHAALHETCPAHGCTGHRHAPPQAPEGSDEPDHEHDLFVLQALLSSPPPSLPSVAGVVWLAAADPGCPVRLTTVVREHASHGVATGPPSALTTVCLLL